MSCIDPYTLDALVRVTPSENLEALQQAQAMLMQSWETTTTFDPQVTAMFDPQFSMIPTPCESAASSPALLPAAPQPAGTPPYMGPALSFGTRANQTYPTYKHRDVVTKPSTTSNEISIVGRLLKRLHIGSSSSQESSGGKSKSDKPSEKPSTGSSASSSAGNATGLKTYKASSSSNAKRFSKPTMHPVKLRSKTTSDQSQATDQAAPASSTGETSGTPSKQDMAQRKQQVKQFFSRLQQSISQSLAAKNVPAAETKAENEETKHAETSSSPADHKTKAEESEAPTASPSS
jgi:hypothetical protein